ncbi:hypothetical protein Rsub_06761 [Raphidocelis subcapitata]|uniref:CDP-diacylglycerol-glycerol-3-phosphate 3-phosphatidyltransferase n=1 Tax=Raphidocelis subcapitata TaxID=307507 RepID=A0A2V0P1B5_9CHLO|nr:hypothetical protein Rsub_06761 [Raphidocelis subcapitata]|eukprot:GBF93658.1 hypothetical protein Rsub_06761 [Raphidocelis subcapitata]
MASSSRRGAQRALALAWRRWHCAGGGSQWQGVAPGAAAAASGWQGLAGLGDAAGRGSSANTGGGTSGRGPATAPPGPPLWSRDWSHGQGWACGGAPAAPQLQARGSRGRAGWRAGAGAGAHAASQRAGLHTAPPPPGQEDAKPSQQQQPREQDAIRPRQRREQEEKEAGEPASGARRRPASGASITSAPNLLSFSRIAAAPVAAHFMLTAQWGPAVALLAAAAVTDWADGALARRLGHTSRLGSYLDPFADKVLVCTVFGCLGWLGLVPAWLSVMVVTRDSAQVAATLAHRAAQFGWEWPGLAEFFDADGPLRRRGGGVGAGSAGGGGSGSASSGGSEANSSSSSVSSSSSSSGGGDSSSGGGGKFSAADAGTDTGAGADADAGAMPRVRPLFVSKLNTALAFALAAAAVAREWQGAPPAEAVELLALAVGATTAASGLAYLWLFRQGRLLK